MLSRLQHKNIAHFVHKGVHRGRNYLATQFIDGESLKRRIEEGALSSEQCVSIALQICEALNYLHGKGILHKDLKPSNVLLLPPNRPVLLDFGIAQRQDEQVKEDKSVEHAEVFGTVNYFSPEQAKGEELDSRTDIYSMGVLLYEMLTGQLPFQGEDNLSVALMHLHQPPTPLREIDEQIPESLNRIVLKALSKQKEQRYHSIREMQMDLQRSLRRPDGRYVRMPQEAMPLTAEDRRVQKKASRHAALAAICLSLAFVAVVCAFFAIFGAMGGSEGNKEVYMPGLAEKTYEEAKQTLEELGLVPIFTYESSLQVEKGYVISQTPQTGAVVNQGEEVSVLISLGGDKVLAMPDVLGRQEQEARAILEEQGIYDVAVSYVDVPGQEVGAVVNQSPDADAQVAEGRRVSITVNKPAQQQSKVAPALVGSDMDKAIDAAHAAGFTRVLINVVSDGQSVGEVVFQSPQAETQNITSDTMYMTVHQPKNGARFEGSFGRDIDLSREGLITATLSFVLGERTYEFVVFEETFQKEALFAQKYPGGMDYSLTLASRFRGQNCVLNVYLNGVVVYTKDV